MRPPPAPATEKKPFKIREAMYDSKDCAAADHAAVPAERHPNQNKTGRRPKYALSQTVASPPTPSMKVLLENWSA